MRYRQGFGIDCANPINRQHWAAQGLVSRWQAIPGLAGGAILHDLMSLPGDLKQGRNGTLSSTSVPKWQPTNRVGGFGQIGFPSAGLITGPLAPINFEYTQPFSIAFWFSLASNGASYSLVGHLDTGNNFRGWECEYQGPGAGNGLQLFLINAFPTTAIQVSTGVAVSAIAAHHAIWTYNGSGNASGISCMLDGQPMALTSSQASSISSTTVNTTPIRMGQRLDGSLQFNGWLDAVSIWSRVLGTAQKTALYQLELQGMPGFLNRVGGIVVTSGSGGPRAPHVVRVDPRFLVKYGAA